MKNETNKADTAADKLSAMNRRELLADIGEMTAKESNCWFFIAVLLRHVRDSKLYQPEYFCFGEYLSKLGFSLTAGNQRIQALNYLADNLPDIHQNIMSALAEKLAGQPYTLATVPAYSTIAAVSSAVKKLDDKQCAALRQMLKDNRPREEIRRIISSFLKTVGGDKSDSLSSALSKTKTALTKCRKQPDTLRERGEEIRELYTLIGDIVKTIEDIAA